KAPNMECMPSHSVNAAAKKQKDIERDSMPPGQARFLLIQGSTRLIMAFPKVNMNKENSRVMPIVWTNDRLLPCPIKDKMTEKINHPMISLTIEEATISIPILDLNISVFISILTTTGRAVMDIAVPIKREKSSLSSSARPKKSG